ncbi:hypothetical protein L218DRAFT_263711 [Marasmius fiardii PR-910]|nr:hypothetical protein L218DRAFT_263711 [Marasmius fiardii PR-910]
MGRSMGVGVLRLGVVTTVGAVALLRFTVYILEGGSRILSWCPIRSCGEFRRSMSVGYQNSEHCEAIQVIHTPVRVPLVRHRMYVFYSSTYAYGSLPLTARRVNNDVCYREGVLTVSLKAVVTAWQVGIPGNTHSEGPVAVSLVRAKEAFKGSNEGQCILSFKAKRRAAWMGEARMKVCRKRANFVGRIRAVLRVRHDGEI